MLYQIILILSIIHICLYFFALEYKSLKYIQDINYSVLEYKKFYYWFYIKNYFNLFFVISIFLDNLYIHLLNIVLVYSGLSLIFKYKNIIKFKITKRIIILFIVTFVISIFVSYVNLYLVLLLFPFINSISIFINRGIDYILNIKYFKKAKKKLDLLNPSVISITGSSGKTSVKNIVYDLIKDNYVTFKTKKSYNTLKGIEISINSIENYYKNCVLVLEMGAKRKKDIQRICNLVKSDIAIITNILPQHLETFKSVDNIIDEKSNVIWSLKSGGKVILNIDDNNLYNLISTIKEKRSDISVYTYSIIDEKCDLYAFDIKYGLDCTCFKIKCNDRVYEIKTKLLGKHSVYNIMCSILVCLVLGIDIKGIEDRINRIKYINNRLQYKKNGNLNILDDSYNSNIDGFLNAIDTLMLYEGKKYLITPGIAETGNSELNKKVALYLKDLDVEVILIDNKSTLIYKEVLNCDKNVYKSFKEAYNYVLKKSENEEICVLIENDLTDNYFL